VLTNDDHYDTLDDHTPSLIPVFDPAFVSTPVVATDQVNSPDTIIHSPPATFETGQQDPPITPPSLPPAHDNMTLDEDSTSSSNELPDLDVPDFRDWKSWSAPCRIAAVRRWIVHAVHKHGPVEHWARDFSEQWRGLKDGDEPAVHGWLDGLKQRMKMGRSALSYLEQAMEGELPASVEDWRDLYAQSHQLACQLWTAILGLQYSIDFVLFAQGSTETHRSLHKWT
jgi:hypothetical protein